MAFKAQLVDLAHTYSGSNIDKSDFDLHREYLIAVKSLRNNDNIVIFKPDKGAGVVILDKQDYNLMAHILNDTINFKIISNAEEFYNIAIELKRIQRELLGFVR